MSRASNSRSNSKLKQGSGIVTKCSSRVAISGNQAHSFYLGDNKYTIFTDDDLSPVADGDRVHFEYEVRHLRNKYRTEYNSVIQDSLAIDLPGGMDADVAGEVYVLSNPSMRGLLKVGCTQGTALKRAAELSGVTGVPTRFQVEWALPIIGDPRAVEQRAHAHLTLKRAGKEFFKVSLEDAKAAISRSFVELYPERAKLMDEAFSKRAEAELSRRADLAEQAERRAREKEEEEKRRHFDQSLEGRWLKEGVCRQVIHEFKSEPNRDFPSFWGKLLRNRYDDYLEFKIMPCQQNGEIGWCLSVSGRVAERSVWKSEILDSKQSAFERLAAAIKEYGVENFMATVEIPNSMLETPPPLPSNVFNPRYVLDVSSTEDLVVRIPPAPPRRSRFSS